MKKSVGLHSRILGIGIFIVIVLSISTSSPVIAELQFPPELANAPAADCEQQPSCKNDCVCEGKTPAQVLSYYENYKGEREKMADACALTCWYQYKGMGISSKDAMEACVPYMNRACDRCKNPPKAPTSTSTSKPRSTNTSTPRITLTPTRSQVTLTPTAILPATIGGRLVTSYLPGGKSVSQTVPLPNALVTVSLAGKQMAAYADENGNFKFTDVNMQLRGINPGSLNGADALVQVDLRSINPAKITTPNFELFYQNQTKPISVKAACPVPESGGAMTCNIDLAKTEFLDTSGVPQQRLVPIGLIYAFADSSDRMQKKLEKNFSMLPVSIRIFYQNTDNKKAWWQAATAPGGNGQVGNIYISENKFRSISTYNPLSFTVPHEFGHQFMADRYEDRIPNNPGDKNHAGYCYNPSSTDAWIEGFATFFASMVKKNYYGKSDFWSLPVGNSRLNLEDNYKAWNFETVAAAGILFDLVDQASDYTHNTDDDGIAISLEDLWKIIIKPVNYRLMRDMTDVYQGLKDGGVGQDDVDEDGLTALDDVFIAHGYYERLDSDQAYNVGEKIGLTTHNQIPECEGKTSNYILGTPRRSPPELPGAYLQLDLRDQLGTPLDSATIQVKIEYGPPLQKYNYAYELSTSELDDNRLYLMLPPPEYSTQAVIQVIADGYTSSQTVVISGQQFWTHVTQQVDAPLLQTPMTLFSIPWVIMGGAAGLCCVGILFVIVLGVAIVIIRRQKR